MKKLSKDAQLQMKDSDIDFSDIPETDEAFWQTAEVIMPEKQKIHIALDASVLSFFKEDGRGYQNRINEVLKSYVRAHQRKTAE